MSKHVNIRLSVRDNAKIVTEAIMRAGISGKDANDILNKTEKIIEDALVEAELNGCVKAAMEAKGALDKGEDSIMVIAEMITANKGD